MSRLLVCLFLRRQVWDAVNNRTVINIPFAHSGQEAHRHLAATRPFPTGSARSPPLRSSPIPSSQHASHAHAPARLGCIHAHAPFRADLARTGAQVSSVRFSMSGKYVLSERPPTGLCSPALPPPRTWCFWTTARRRVHAYALIRPSGLRRRGDSLDARHSAQRQGLEGAAVGPHEGRTAAVRSVIDRSLGGSPQALPRSAALSASIGAHRTTARLAARPRLPMRTGNDY